MSMFIDEIVNSCYQKNEYPALSSFMAEWMCTRPFEGLRILVATPIFRNTLLEYKALLVGGANLAVGCADGGMPCDEGICEILQKKGIPVLQPQDVLNDEADGDFFDLILDCAGQFACCHPRYGFVELTKSGVQFYENTEAPVYVADSGIVKRIETSLGTGDGYIRALAHLGYDCLDGKNFVVFGSGKVGVGIVLQLLRCGALVNVVTDMSSGVNGFLIANSVPVVDCKNFEEVAQVIQNADFVVTATGKKNALAVPKITSSLLECKAVLANMGVEDEYGIGVPEDRVLAKKAPLNFILEEPTHLKYIDASLALHAALGERLVQEALGFESFESTKLRNPPSELEQRILVTSMQEGLIGPEINEMIGGPYEE